jgi:hypothetical protein
LQAKKDATPLIVIIEAFSASAVVYCKLVVRHRDRFISSAILTARSAMGALVTRRVVTPHSLSN